METQMRVAIIGAGSMGGALASGLVASGVLTPEQLAICDLDQDKLSQLSASVGMVTFTEAQEMLSQDFSVVVLAVKPQVLAECVEPIASLLADKLVISIAAGVNLATLEQLMPASRVVRVMPNLAIQVRSGAAAIALGESASTEDEETVLKIFSAFGPAFVVSEVQLDVCGVSVGCAPALFALMLDSLTRAAVRRGVPAAIVRPMLESTMAGTATMMLESGEHPRSYMEKVSSPGGTTIEFLRELEPYMAEGCELGTDAALARSDELAGKKKAGR